METKTLIILLFCGTCIFLIILASVFSPGSTQAEEAPQTLPQGYTLMCSKEGMKFSFKFPDGRLSANVWDTVAEAISWANSWEILTERVSSKYEWREVKNSP